jgi:hypothetical protein
MAAPPPRFARFGEFYPCYLSEHRDPGDWVMYRDVLTGRLPS